LMRLDEALASHDRAIALRPEDAEFVYERARVLNDLKRFDEALACSERAIAIKPNYAAAFYYRGRALEAMQRFEEALASYDRAIALNRVQMKHSGDSRSAELEPRGDASTADDQATNDLAGAWLGRGNVLTEFREFDLALTAYDRALTIKPHFSEALLGRGNVFYRRSQYGEAFSAYDKALATNPNLDYARGDRCHAKLFICDWVNVEDDVAGLLSAVRSGKPACAPFPFLAISSSSQDQLWCAKRYSAGQLSFPKMWSGEKYSHHRIHVAYLSSDFRDHPVGHLMAGLFEEHDKSRFEMTAISLRPCEDTDLHRRIKNAFEHFIDVGSKSDEDVAKLIRQREIDIAVDLNGHTSGSRPYIISRRPAPIQMSYLGFPGTTGAPYMDYVLGDSTTIPDDQFQFYSEQVVRLPESFMVNDRRLRTSSCTPTRKECRLPDDAFVFCCFNTAYKIMPDVFDIWMRLLRANENSVLWLIDSNETATANLCKEAEKRGVPSARLIFSPRIELAEHVARQPLADLFLDTLPYNAGMTANIALWAGLPVVTCLGSTFVGRMGGSLLNAVGLPDLVTTSLDEYEALALRLARDSSFLLSLKEKLTRNRDTCPLFNTARFTRHLEMAYTMMWERYQRGDPPQSFDVPASNASLSL
jgi:protein O-GlcNAc transferase